MQTPSVNVDRGGINHAHARGEPGIADTVADVAVGAGQVGAGLHRERAAAGLHRDRDDSPRMRNGVCEIDLATGAGRERRQRLPQPPAVKAVQAHIDLVDRVCAFIGVGLFNDVDHGAAAVAPDASEPAGVVHVRRGQHHARGRGVGQGADSARR